MPTSQALQIAFDAGMDLVEVGATSRPPVCKIQDYGKLKYELKKKQAKNAKQHQVQVKEIRLRPKTGEHDIDFKVKHARDFLADKDKVKVTVVFKGRELAHQEKGREILEEVIKQLADVAKLERSPAHEGGKQIFCVLAPK